MKMTPEQVPDKSTHLLVLRACMDHIYKVMISEDRFTAKRNQKKSAENIRAKFTASRGDSLKKGAKAKGLHIAFQNNQIRMQINTRSYCVSKTGFIWFLGDGSFKGQQYIFFSVISVPL
jgi:hypothetical protein